MGWKIVTVSEAPLGSRSLRAGSRGEDVRELQHLLAEAGFYFGPVDGIYGILTEEAVSLFQRTFNLRNDGVAAESDGVSKTSVTCATRGWWPLAPLE